MTAAVFVALAGSAAAQLASRPADEWVKTLESPERLASLKIEDVVARVKVKPGDVVADLGAGTGPFVVPLARAVTSRGKVYAVDIDNGFFPHIQRKAKDAGVGNVTTVLGGFTDPKLPAADVDVAFLHDVLHHIEDRPAYLKRAVTYLKPSGRIVVVEFNPAQSPHRDEPALVVSREQSAAWMKAVGFTVLEDIALFDDKWFVVYGR